jgi:hypothetical protein
MRLLAGHSVTEQTMQVIASVCENNVITTISRTTDIYFDIESLMGSVILISNVILNTPVTLVFGIASLSPRVNSGEANFICTNENIITFTVTASESEICAIILE